MKDFKFEITSRQFEDFVILYGVIVASMFVLGFLLAFGFGL